MKILVTGAAGFIGSNLSEYLLEKGFEVIGLDNFSTGYEKNITSLNKFKKFQFLQGDIRELNTCIKASKGVSIVLHQAALGSVPRSIKDPLTSNEVNINGFLNILEASKQNSVKRFIYAASSSTYGDSKELPKVENNIGKPLSPYAITKYVNELYAEIYSNIYGIETIGLRYFNVFGRRQDPNGTYAAVIPKFISQFLKKESPVINGDGSFSRDFTYIDNVLQMNYLAMTTKNQKAINQVYNTAVGHQTTIKEMALKIKDELSFYKKDIANIPISFGVERFGDIPHSKASIDKAIFHLNYRPSHNFNSGIENYIKWFMKNEQLL